MYASCNLTMKGAFDADVGMANGIYSTSASISFVGKRVSPSLVCRISVWISIWMHQNHFYRHHTSERAIIHLRI